MHHIQTTRASQLLEEKKKQKSGGGVYFAPFLQQLTFGVAAADDVMIFSSAGEGITADRGVLKNESKDVNDELNAVCVGVELEHGLSRNVPAGRCLSLVLGVLHLAETRLASPKQVHQQLGTVVNAPYSRLTGPRQ